MNWWKTAYQKRTPQQLWQKCRKELNSLQSAKGKLAVAIDPKERAELQLLIENSKHGVDLWCRMAKPSAYRWNPVADGKYRDGDAEYRVSDIISHAEGLPVTMMDVDTLVAHNGETGTKEGLFSEQVRNPSAAFRDRVERSDLRYPILIDPDGWLIDGAHRLAKAKWDGRREIEAKIVDISGVEPSHK